MLLQAGLSSVCYKGASHGDVSFKHTEHTLGRKLVGIRVVLLFS